MENLVAQPTTPHWLSYVGAVGRLLSLFRALRQSLGRAPTKESRVLAEMIVALKTASETALQTRVKAAAVTAPWVAAWDNQIPADSVLNDALLLAGLEPWSRWADAENYLGEINAALAGEERWICKRHWCAGHGMEVKERTSDPGVSPISYQVDDSFLKRVLTLRRTACLTRTALLTARYYIFPTQQVLLFRLGG